MRLRRGVDLMKEFEIRPRNLFDQFLAAVEDDANRLFADHSGFETIPCPACASADVSERFTKIRFGYARCAACGSLYLTPRPPAAMFDQFYRDSNAVEFFANRFYRDTEAVRRERMFKPRARLVADWAAKLGAADRLVDIGAGFGTFLEEVRATGAFGSVVAVEPARKLSAVCREKGLDVLEMPVERAAVERVEASFSTCFEVFEHVHDPLAFVRAMGAVVRPGGVVFFTTLTISGFDLLELWDQSKSIMPPNHINLLSTQGLRTLVERAGLELVDLSTPGRLDVDIVANMLQEKPDLRVSRFAREIATAPEASRQAFQQFLQAHGFSSHVQVIARRPA
jgi:SAM-dependent methyltransferase